MAVLAAVVRDVGVAVDLAQEAMAAASWSWSEQGVSDDSACGPTPIAGSRAAAGPSRDRPGTEQPDRSGCSPNTEESVARDDRVGDDLVKLILATCHPVLPTPSRVALTLRAVGGLTTAEIARAFLVPERTVAQRIVRAERTLTDRKVAIDLPTGDELSLRLASVLEVVHLVFNEGHAVIDGTDRTGVDLCAEALRLARLLDRPVVEEPEVLGSLGLLEIQTAWSAARIDPDGKPVPPEGQDRSRWDQEAIDRGLAAVDRAERLTDRPGPYLVQARIVACRARAVTAADTDWPRITELYGRLAELIDSPVVELNLAMAVARTRGPRAGLAHLTTIADPPGPGDGHLLPMVRGDLLAELGDLAAARTAFETALGLTGSAIERDLLRGRIAALADRGTGRFAGRVR